MAQGPLSRALTWAVLPAAAVYVLALLLSQLAGIRSTLVIRDLAQTCDTPLGVALLSSLGYLLWVSAAAVAAFAALGGSVHRRGRERQLLLWGSAFSMVLCLDDMFLLHDRYVGATVLYALYAAFALLILLRYRSQVLQLGGGSFLLAVGLLGISVLIDQFQQVIPVPYDTLQLFEEGAKFLGIACWLAFWWLAGAAAGKLRAQG
jgi:hypothetical protein